MEIRDILSKEFGVRSNHTVDKKWGAEHHIIFREGMVGKVMDLKQHFGCSVHFHKDKFETFYMLSGKMLVGLTDTHTGETTWHLVEPGQILDIERYMPHQFIGLEDSKFVEFAIVKDGGTGEMDSFRTTQSREFTSDEILEILNKVKASDSS